MSYYDLAPCRVPLLALLICFAVIPLSPPSAASRTDTLQQLRHAAQQQTNNPVHHIQLAVALHELNHQKPDGGSRVPEAEHEYRTALSLISQGQHAAVYAHVQGNLGALLLSADRPAEAITEFEGAMKLGQQLQEQLQQQIKQHKKTRKKHKQQQQRASAALSELQQELKDVQQQLAGATFNLGKAVTSIGRLAEADEMHTQAAAAAYGNDFSSYGKAVAAMGRIQQVTAAKALQVCQEATRHFATQPQLSFLSDIPPPPAPAVGDLSSTDSATAAADSDTVSKGAQLDKAPQDWISNGQSVDLVWLYFALHKHYHHAKQPAVAWYYLQLGNRIMGAHVHYDLAKEQKNLGHIRSLFRAPFTTSGLQDRTAIFVVGMPRSGSTLVEQMLASHPQVFAAGEDTAMAPLTSEINRALASSSPTERPAILTHFAERYLTAMRARVPANWPSQHRDPSTDRMTGTDNASGATAPARIVDKMLRNLWLVGYIHMLLPKSCIVHVVRHPMDVALSCYAQPFGFSSSAMAWSWDLVDIATQIEMTWEVAEHWEQHLPGRIYTVFYEELVERPEAVAAQLLSACGLDWDPAVLSFHNTKRSVQTASMAQVRQPLYKTAVQRWKVYEQQLEPLRETLAPLTARYEQMLLQRMSAAAPRPAAAAADIQDSKAGQDQMVGSSDSVKDEL